MLNHLWGLEDKEVYEKKKAKEGGALKESGEETLRSKSSFKIASYSSPHVRMCSAAAQCKISHLTGRGGQKKKIHHGVLNNASHL